MTVRQAALKLHLWMALVGGAFILIASATGALLVFEREINSAQDAALRIESGVPPLPLDDLVVAVQAASPQQKVRGVVFPEHEPGAINVALPGRAVMVDPGTGRILAEVANGSRLANMIEGLHLNLRAGPWGNRIVGTATLLCLLAALTGLYLWWPRRLLRFRRDDSGRRFMFDLHNISGFWTSAFLVVVTGTGLTMFFGNVTDPMLKRLDPAQPQAPPQSAFVEGTPPISLDELVRRARAALPGAQIRNFPIPAGPKAAYRVQMRFPEDKTPGGRSQVFIDQYSGDVLRVQSSREAGPGTWFLNIQRSIHTGEIWGWPTRSLAFATCLSVLVQLYSGILLWWRRTRPRKV
ncbi:MAG: PepSY domain-containing protein [Vicinamibacteria bacterium]|nr:PepSY domain-containing protein [Vicinamibacteria bacterium]